MEKAIATALVCLNTIAIAGITGLALGLFN